MSSTNSSKNHILTCAKAAIDKKAENSIIFDVQKISSFADFFLVTSGSNERQVQAIADEIIRLCKAQGLGKGKTEGYDEGRWILVDFGDVVVHVFHETIREFYKIEELWRDASRVSIPQEYYTSPMSGGSSSPAHI